MLDRFCPIFDPHLTHFSIADAFYGRKSLCHVLLWVQNNFGPFKLFCWVQNHFGPIEGQGIRIFFFKKQLQWRSGLDGGQKLDKIGQPNWWICYMIKKLGTGVSKIWKFLLWIVPFKTVVTYEFKNVPTIFDNFW